MLTSHDVGRRVSVRRRVEGGLTDVLGHLLDLADDHLDVLSRRRGADRWPPPTSRQRRPCRRRRHGAAGRSRDVSPDDMQRICWAGWPARESELLGDWALRAHGGITGRANSAMAVGDPGRPLPEALRRVAAWYAERGLPPLLQLPLADPANLVDGAGGLAPAARHDRAGGADRAGARRRTRPGRRWSPTSTPEPSADWLSLMHDLDEGDPDAHVAILTGPARVGFATLRRDGDPVGIGRVSVEGEWAGVTSVDVAPAARRQGIGSAVMRELLRWAQAAGRGLVVPSGARGNPGALRLYDALGYATHHPYCYRAPSPGSSVG